MARKSKYRSFDETLDALRSKGFEVSSFQGIPNGTLVSRGGVAAVIVPGHTNPKWDDGGQKLAVSPGVLIRGEIARLLDRGYQKFIRTSQYEIPATAAQLHAIQDFTNELNLVTGALGLYNEALGTTSDVYLYDRVRGREEAKPNAPGPWELAGGH